RDVAVAGLLEAGDHAGGAEAEGCCHAHTATSLALGVRIRGRTVLTDSLARSLIRPPRWHSESAFADALSLPIRSHARSYGHLAGTRSPHSRTHCPYRFARTLAHTATSLALGVRIRGRTVLTDSLARSLMGRLRGWSGLPSRGGRA